MGKHNKGQKPAKGSKEVDSFSLTKVSDAVHHQQPEGDLGSGDVISGFGFLKSFVSDDAMGDSPIAACLKKMAKKDSTTKIKALQDFVELVNNCDNDLSPCLQLWSRCYCRLTMCGDHRVRELAQTALSAVISKAGRLFAPCLKIVIPYCILSHADNIAAVASAAKLCLESAFNENRRTQAILMCKLQIFELISSIIKSTNPYLADKSLGLDEEELLRRDRLLSACLGGWSIVAVNQPLELVSDGASATAQADEAVNDIVADILTSREFNASILKSDSLLVLTALHVWIVTMCQYCPTLVAANSKMFISTVFLVPQNEGDMATRIVDVGSWQSAAALSKITDSDLYWKQPAFEKQLSKKLNLLLANGPSQFLPPPTPFFAVACIPILNSMSESLITLLRIQMANSNFESIFKMVKRLISESATQGLHKAKPFHARHQELSTFCDTVFGFILVFMDKPECSQEILEACFNGALKLFSGALKLDPSCSVTVFPYFVRLYATFSSNSTLFQAAFNEAMLREVQYLITGPDTQSNEVANFASFLNLFSSGKDTARHMLSTFAQTVCNAVGSMRTFSTCGNVFNFLCSLLPSLVSSFADDPSLYKELSHEVQLLAEEIINTDYRWQENSDTVITKLLLRWDFLLSEENLHGLLQKLCQKVTTLQDLIALIPRLSSKYWGSQSVVLLCANLLSSSAFFSSPREVSNLLIMVFSEVSKQESTASVELLKKNVTLLLEQVASQMTCCDSSYYLGRLLTRENEPALLQHDASPIEILSGWLNKREDMRPKVLPVHATLECFTEIFQKLGDFLTFSDTETTEKCLAIQLVACCYNSFDSSAVNKLLEKYSLVSKGCTFLVGLRDLMLYNNDTFCLMMLGVTEVVTRNRETLMTINRTVEKLPAFSAVMDNWLLSHCISLVKFAPNSSVSENNDNYSADSHVKDLVISLIALLSSICDASSFDLMSKPVYETIAEAVSAVELKSSTSWLDVQLLEFVDELLLSQKNEPLLINFINYARTLFPLKSRWVFSYLLNGRHSSSSLERIIATIASSLVVTYDQQHCNDVWLLSEVVNRILRSERQFTKKPLALLSSVAAECVNAIAVGCTTAELAQQNLHMFSQLASALTTNFCGEILFDETVVKSAVKALTTPFLETVFIRENTVESEEKFFTRLEATADLAIFLNCCLRYTPKLANIDPIMCYVCSWISTAKKLVDRLAAHGLSKRDDKIKLSRFLVATTECAHTIHKVFSSAKTFAFTPSENQQNEFNEFYQLQYLDALIQLLITLWLPVSPGDHSFLSHVLANRTIQNQLTFAIVSCLHKATSIDIIAHVHLDPLFCADESYLPEDVQTIISRLSPLITDAAVDDVRVHLAIFAVLSTLTPTLSGIYFSLSGDISQQRDNDDDFVLTPPRVWLREIAELTESVSTAVTSDSWRSHPERISSWLYVWLLVLRLAGSLPSEVRPPMVNFFRKSPDFQALLLNVFALAPSNPKLIDVAPFDSLPQLSSTSDPVPLVGHLACYIIRELLATFPAVVRSWLNDQTTWLRRSIVAYVSAHLSPQLRAVELSKVRQAEFDEAIKIRAMTATGELVATYQSEQVRLDLTVHLPDDYPLSAPSIECKQNVLSSTCKLWLRQLTALLICQNGAVLDALLLWQKLITEKLGKLEECTICYSIVQGGNLNLPKRQCRTCKKRFHSACLFKWFESSGNVTCPLCREQFY